LKKVNNRDVVYKELRARNPDFLCAFVTALDTINVAQNYPECASFQKYGSPTVPDLEEAIMFIKHYKKGDYIPHNTEYVHRQRVKLIKRV
jgi:hypothetical protein